MHKYNKREINKLVHKAFFQNCTVTRVNVDKEDMLYYKLTFTKNNNNTSKVDEPAKKKSKMDTNGIDDFKSVLSREGETDKSRFKSSSKPKNEIVSTSTEEVSIETNCEKSSDSSNSSANNILTKIQVIDPRKIMDQNKYINYTNVFLDKKLYSTKVKAVKHAMNENFSLIVIEKLYNKYFSKFVQDTIEIIANLYIIYINIFKQYIERIKTSFNIQSKAEKLKEKYDANFLHKRQKKILERKLKINLTSVVSLFFEPEFEMAFKMFFLSILTVLRVLKQPKFWKSGMFKNLSQCLLNCLKNGECNGSRVFSMLQSNTFQLDCINMMSEIENSKDYDPGITDRLTLFFVISVNSQKYFQKIIDAIVSESVVDLEILIDEASFQCFVNSIFKDPIHHSTVQGLNVEYQ